MRSLLLSFGRVFKAFVSFKTIIKVTRNLSLEYSASFCLGWWLSQKGGSFLQPEERFLATQNFWYVSYWRSFRGSRKGKSQHFVEIFILDWAIMKEIFGDCYVCDIFGPSLTFLGWLDSLNNLSKHFLVSLCGQEQPLLAFESNFRLKVWVCPKISEILYVPWKVKSTHECIHCREHFGVRHARDCLMYVARQLLYKVWSPVFDRLKFFLIVSWSVVELFLYVLLIEEL